MAGDATVPVPMAVPDRGLAIVFRLLIPNPYGLVHFWIPLVVAALLFYLCSPGVLMLFSGSSFRWARPSASTRKLARWHTLVFAMALALLVVFLALVPRVWPGTHPYDAIAVRSDGTG